MYIARRILLTAALCFQGPLAALEQLNHAVVLR
jgi:hypothetical protein